MMREKVRELLGNSFAVLLIVLFFIAWFGGCIGIMLLYGFGVQWVFRHVFHAGKDWDSFIDGTVAITAMLFLGVVIHIIGLTQDKIADWQRASQQLKRRK